MQEQSTNCNKLHKFRDNQTAISAVLATLKQNLNITITKDKQIEIVTYKLENGAEVKIKFTNGKPKIVKVKGCELEEIKNLLTK